MSGITPVLRGVTLPLGTHKGILSLARPIKAEAVRMSTKRGQPQVLPAGFELLWVVKSRAAVAELVKRWGRSGQLVLPTTISVDGDVASSAGGLVVSDAKGKRVGSFGAPVMWEASSSLVEERGESTAVVFRVDPKKGRGKGLQGSRRVDVVASVAWLNQPTRRFPVTIDPTYASDFRAPVFDTFVQQGYTTDQSAGGELKLGNNGAGQVARTYMNFDAALFKGRTIVAASLSLFAKYSWSCTARPWSAYDAGLASAASRWSSQPVVGAKVGSSTATRGYSSACPAGRVSMSNLTGVAQTWSGATSAQVGLMLRADDEADPWGWKRFYSANSAYQPLLSVSYNRVMAAPGAPGVSGPLYRGVVWTTRTPTLTAVVPHDPDGDTVRADFGVFTSSTAGTGAVGSCRTGVVAGGSSVSCVTSALPDNRTLWARYRVWDGRNYSAWSPARQFTVADSVPDTPTIACVAPFSNGSWADAAPATDVACKLTVTGSNTSAPLWATYTVDGTTYNLSPPQPTATKPSVYNFYIKKGVLGQHTVTAWAASPIGKKSATASYRFGFGSAAFEAPTPDAVTTDTVRFAVASPPGASAVAVSWRVAGAGDATSGWVGVPDSATAKVALRPASGSAVGIFDVKPLVGAADGSGARVSTRTAARVELRACFTYPSGTRCASRSVVRVPHAYGAGFPTSDAGPVSVALWTGEAQVSETDAEFTTPGAGLSVSRTHSSLAGPAEPRNAIFGPGWRSAFDVDVSAGLSGSQVIDDTRSDGTIVVGRQAMMNVGTDAVLSRVQAVRAVRVRRLISPLPRRASGVKGVVYRSRSAWLERSTYASRSAAYVLRRQPFRTRVRLAANTYSLFNALR